MKRQFLANPFDKREEDACKLKEGGKSIRSLWRKRQQVGESHEMFIAHRRLQVLASEVREILEGFSKTVLLPKARRAVMK